MKRRVLLGVACVLLIAQPASAAEASAVLAQIDQLKQEAMTAFDAYAYKKGSAKLEKALQLARKEGQTKHPKVAEVYILLAVAAISGKSDVYRGVHAFVAALRISNKVKIPRRLVTPELKRVFTSAKRTIGALGEPPKMKVNVGNKAPKRTADGRTVKKGAKGLDHVPIDEARRGYPILVRAALGADIRAKRVFLYYRPAGTVKYSKLEMKPEANTYRGKIPAQFTKGRYVHYYIEARDPRGRVVASNGGARGPNVVIIKSK